MNITKHSTSGHTVESIELNRESTRAKLSYAVWISFVSLLNPSKRDLEKLSAHWRSGRVRGSDPISRSLFWVVFWCNNYCEHLSSKGSYLVFLTSLQLHLFILSRWVSFSGLSKSFNSLAVKIKCIHFAQNRSANFVRALWKWAVWEASSELEVIFLTTIHLRKEKQHSELLFQDGKTVFDTTRWKHLALTQLWFIHSFNELTISHYL